ncbi:hypothetical protein B0T18DRAFT_3924, partial [Schizothecium vesticola]
SFRLIAQSHLGPCWSWPSATHLLLCACSVLTLVHSPQCHSRSSYRPPEASPPCRCRLSGLSLGSYPRAVSSRLSSTPGWTGKRLSHPPVSPFPKSRGLARNGTNKPWPCRTGESPGQWGAGHGFGWCLPCAVPRLPLQQAPQTESRTRLQPYNSSEQHGNNQHLYRSGTGRWPWAVSSTHDFRASRSPQRWWLAAQWYSHTIRYTPPAWNVHNAQAPERASRGGRRNCPGRQIRGRQAEAVGGTGGRRIPFPQAPVSARIPFSGSTKPQRHR